MARLGPRSTHGNYVPPPGIYDQLTGPNLNTFLQAQLATADSFSPTNLYSFNEDESGGATSAQDLGPGPNRSLGAPSSPGRVVSAHGQAGILALGAAVWATGSTFALNPGSVAWAVASRLKFDALSGTGELVMGKSGAGGTGGAWGLRLSATNKLTVYVRLSDGVTEIETPELDISAQVGAPFFALFGRSVTRGKLWLRTAAGYVEVDMDAAANGTSNSSPFRLGVSRAGAAGGACTGYVDHLIDWFDATTAESVDAHQVALLALG